MRRRSRVLAFAAVVMVATAAAPAAAGDPPAAQAGDRARAAAVQAILRAVENADDPADAERVRFAARVAEAVAGPDPSLRASVRTRLAALRAKVAVRPAEVIERLRDAVAKADGAKRDDLAFLGARALRGLGVQRRRAAGSGVADPLEDEALAVMDRVRAARWASAKPLTVEALRAIPPGRRRDFAGAHDTWDAPTLAVTPDGLYRIESVCGPRTTLLLAHDLDALHRRLARFCGTDPFEGRPGVVRLVLGVADMEGEGQSLLWARAFNAGTVTTSPMQLTSRRWTLRGFGHELLHRFDSELYGRLPGWLCEGRANWAQSATALPGAEELDRRLVDFPMLERAHRAGSAEPARLTALLDGRPANSQEVYDAGYALWLHLARFGAARYAGRIPAYLSSHRADAAKGPRPLFVAAFCDGSDGRPASLDAFAAEFAAFLAAAAGPETGWKAEWLAAHRAAEREADAARAAPPPPGAKEFAWAGDEEVFDASNAVPDRTRHAVPALGERHAFAAGTFLAATGDLRGATLAFAWSREVDEPSRETLEILAAHADRTGNAAAGWVLRCDAWRMGGPPAGRPPQPVQAVVQAIARLADDTGLLRDAAGGQAPPAGKGALPRQERADELGIGPGTWAPAGATGTSFDLRDGRDLVLAVAPSARPVYVETADGLGAAWSLAARFRPEPADTDFAFVLGKTGPDRGLTVRLVPVPDSAPGRFRGLRVRFDDLRDADWGVCTPESSCDLAAPAADAEVRVHVRGAYVSVEVDGTPVASRRTLTGLPLDGRLGFLLRSGSAEVCELAFVRLGTGQPVPLDLSGPPARGAWNGRRVEAPAPHPEGRLLVVCPRTSAPDAATGDRLTALVPALLGSADLAPRVTVVGGAPSAALTGAPPGAATWLALDAGGFVRSHGVWRAGDPELHRARTLLRRLRGW